MKKLFKEPNTIIFKHEVVYFFDKNIQNVYNELRKEKLCRKNLLKVKEKLKNNCLVSA